MSKISDRVSYLQGLAEGMKLNTEKDSNRLLLGVLDVLADISEAMDELEASHEELSEYVDSIDEDLADLEAELYDDEDDEYYGDEEDSEEDDEDDEDDDDVFDTDDDDVFSTDDEDDEDDDDEDGGFSSKLKGFFKR